MIAVTFALPNESSEFVRRLRRKDGLPPEEVRVFHTGVGETMTRSRLPDLWKGEQPRLLISAGFAGAVSEQLRVGDLLLAENFSDPALVPDLRIFHRGNLATIHGVIDSTEERSAIARRHGALAVDMETEFIAQFCAARSIPLVSLRAISDTPAAPFGIPAAVLFDVARQRTPYASLAFYLVRQPRAIAKLRALAKQISRARNTLTEGLEQLLRAIAR